MTPSKPAKLKHGKDYRHFLIADTHYGQEVLVVQASSSHFKRAAQLALPKPLYAEMDKEGLLDADPDSLACVVFHKHVILVRLPLPVSVPVMVHESLHLTSRILRKRGLELTDASEEAFTYHLAWIVEGMMQHCRIGKISQEEGFVI